MTGPVFKLDASLTSPNVGNYYLGKGNMYLRLLGESVYAHMGNSPQFEFQAKVTQLDHYSSMTGVRIKDYTAVNELAGSLTIVLEEFTARNMGLALLGLPSGGPSPDPDVIDVFSEPVIYGAVRFIGANDVGPTWQVDFPLVNLKPNRAVSFIGNQWGTIEINGDVLFDRASGTFGVARATMPNSPRQL